jgi:hypothetical protein
LSLGEFAGAMVNLEAFLPPVKLWHS